MRFIVAQPIVSEFEPGLNTATIGVGVVRWEAPKPTLTIIAKAVMSYDEHGRCSGLGQAGSLCVDTAYEEEKDSSEQVFYSSDFVPRKAKPEVLVVGRAYAKSASERFSARVCVGDVDREVELRAPAPTTSVPLATKDCDTRDRTVRVGPVRAAAVPGKIPEDFDFSLFNAAPREQQCAKMPLAGELTLAGLHPQGPVTIALPGAPVVAVDTRWGLEPIDMVCDTLWLDTEKRVLTLVWRGEFELDRLGRGPDRIRVDGRYLFSQPTDKIELFSLARANLSFASETGALSAEPLTEAEKDALQVARYETWLDDEGPPETTLSLAAYAQISAELAEETEPRKEVLKRHDLDEDQWALEEHGWLGKMAVGTLNNDGGLAVRFGDLFVAAQDELGGAEVTKSPDEYTTIAVQLETAEEPAAVLTAHSMTLADWLRLERKYRNARKDDPALSRQLDEQLASKRAGRALEGVQE